MTTVGWLILQRYNGEWVDEQYARLFPEDEAREELAHWSQAYSDTEWRLARVVLEEGS